MLLSSFRPIPSAWVTRAAISLLACLLAVWVECGKPEFAVRIDESLRDMFLQANVDSRLETRLTVVDLDEDALTEIGAWPWARSQIADLVETLLSHYGVRAVALDVVLPEPADAEGDARLAVLADHAPFVLSQVFDYAPRSQTLTLGVLSGGRAGADSDAPVAYGYIANHVGLANAPCVGNIGYSPDIDGVLRRIPILTYYRGQVFPHLTLALLSCAALRSQSGRVPNVGTDGFWRIPYRYAPSSYTVMSAADILRERAPKELLEGRYVLVGSSALGLGDRVSTPLSSLSAGVMVHASSLSALLDLVDGKTRSVWSGQALILGWTVASVIVAVALMAQLSAWSSILVLLSFLLIWLSMAFVGVQHQADGSIFAPLSAYLILLVAAIPHEWWRSQRSAKRLLTTFSHYVAKPVLTELLRAGATYSLTPTLREVTVLIADMEDYTPTTSSLSLDDAADLTKEFLDCLTRPVLSGHGTLDKYTGDGLVAFWGAPLDCADQADQAVTAALAILEEVDALNAHRSALGFRPVRVRIGIESGKALVGDLGTPFRSTYTAVGDCINFASRLERAARDLPVQVVIGPVASGLLTRYISIPLGRHTLRGTETEIDLFTVQ
jgi:adenylate cyclase